MRFRYCIETAVLLWALLALMPVFAASAEDSIEWYDQQLYKDLQQVDEQYRQWAAVGYLGTRAPDGSSGYYRFAEITDGIAAIYEATGREYYLERLIDYCKLIMAQGIDNNGDGYLDYFHWMSDRERAEKYDKWDYEHHYAAACHCNTMRSIARCARVGRLGAHYDNHKSDVDAIIAFMEKHVIEKWEKGDQQLNITDYLALSNITINGIPSHLGSILVDAWLATANEHYRELAARFALLVKRAWVQYSNGSYVWSADAGIKVPVDYMGTDYNMQDISHGSRVIRFAVAAHRAGIVIDDTDIQRLVATFNLNLWRGTDRKLAEYVNGSETNPDRGSTLIQWVQLGAFDVEARQRMADWTGGWPSKDGSVRHRIPYYGNMALHLKLEAEGTDLQPRHDGGRRSDDDSNH